MTNDRQEARERAVARAWVAEHFQAPPNRISGDTIERHLESAREFIAMYDAVREFDEANPPVTRVPHEGKVE